MKRNSWQEYQKQIADDRYYYARSCIRQNFFPGSERAFIDILTHDLGKDLLDDPKHSSCTGIGYHSDIVPLETIMTVVARQFALMNEAGYENFVTSCITSFGIYTEILATWEEFPETEERTREYLRKATGREFQKPASLAHTSDIVFHFREAIAEIRRLSPKPGNLYTEGGTDTTPYIIPDFILDYQDGRFALSLNSYNVPEVRINHRYMEMIRDMVSSDGTVKEKDKEALQFVKNKIDSAKWFISAIKQRHDTLMRTMQTILDYQTEYFKDGDQSKLRPMILKDIADRTGLDVSTISRVVNSKYVQTQFGIILLKSLFSEAMQTESGEEVSSYEIKNILQQCIDEEEKRHPLTDETLMDILNAKGYRIARRTVAKYREMLGIPVARLRKQI